MKKIDIHTFLNVIFTYAASWIGANLFVEAIRFCAVYELDFFARRIDASASATWTITYEICFLISFVLFHGIFFMANKIRKQTFIKDTQGLITQKDGVVYHIKRYWKIDMFSVVIQTLLYSGLYSMNRTYCPFALLYNAVGIPFGLICNLFLMFILQINHILWAQYHWRVQHYMYE